MATTGSRNNSLTLEAKVKIIREVESGRQKSAVADEYGIPSSTLSTIIKNKDKILEYHGRTHPNRKRIRTGYLDDVEQALLEWIEVSKSMNFPINHTTLRSKALDIAHRLGHNAFIASGGWVSRFKTRHGISLRGESREPPRMDPGLESWLKDLPDLVEGYEKRNVFAADEIGLIYDLLPEKAAKTSQEEIASEPENKNRLTVLLCCNMDGSEKLRPLVVRKSSDVTSIQPYNGLRLDVASTDTGLMTPKLFEKWLHEFDRSMRSQCRHVIIFVDKCFAHHVPQLVLHNVRLLDFPPIGGGDAKTQPLRHGIIQGFKNMYRSRLLKQALVSIEACRRVCISLEDAYCLIVGSWKALPEACIKMSFRATGFPVGRVEGVSSSNRTDLEGEELLSELRTFTAIPHSMSFSKFVNIDDTLPARASDILQPPQTRTNTKGSRQKRPYSDNDEHPKERLKLKEEPQDPGPSQETSEEAHSRIETSAVNSASCALMMLQDVRRFLLTTGQMKEGVIEKIQEVEDYCMSLRFESNEIGTTSQNE